MCDMAQELQHQEEQEQAGLEPHLRNILKGKRLRLFETLLTSIDYPDKGLVQDMKRGFRLTGWLRQGPPRSFPRLSTGTKSGRTGVPTTEQSGSFVVPAAMLS